VTSGVPDNERTGFRSISSHGVTDGDRFLEEQDAGDENEMLATRTRCWRRSFRADRTGRLGKRRVSTTRSPVGEWWLP